MRAYLTGPYSFIATCFKDISNIVVKCVGGGYEKFGNINPVNPGAASVPSPQIQTSWPQFVHDPTALGQLNRCCQQHYTMPRSSSIVCDE